MTHDEIIDGLHMASGIVQNRRMLLQGKTHGRDLSPAELCLDSSYTSAIDACAAATAAQAEIQRLTDQRDSWQKLAFSRAEHVQQVMRECDALAAKLAEVERQEPMVIGACITAGRLHATVMRREANGHVTVLAAAELGVDMLHKRDCLAKLEPAAEPALEMLREGAR